MSIALKVFCVGVTFGGASGLAPLIPVAKSENNSSLDSDKAKRIKRAATEEQRICWGYADDGKAEYGKNLKRSDVRIVFSRADGEICQGTSMGELVTRDGRVKVVKGLRSRYWVVDLSGSDGKKVEDIVERKCGKGKAWVLRGVLNENRSWDTIRGNYGCELGGIVRTVAERQIGDGTGVVNK